MRKAQKNFLNYLDAVEQTIRKLQVADHAAPIDPRSIDNLRSSIRERELLVPVVGAFSAGKSSLINAILGRGTLPVAITPETAIPTELRYDVRERIEAFFDDGRTEEHGVETLPDLQSRASEIENVRVYLNSPALQSLSPLVLVDMPGFNSPLDAHNKAIARYIGEGAHYLFVVSVEEGTLHSSTLSYIDDIANLGRSFSVCVNKADLRPKNDVAAICANIARRLEDENLTAHVCHVSEDDPGSVRDMLAGIDPEVLFTNVFLPPLKQQHRAIEDVVRTLQDALRRDKQANDASLKELEEALRDLEDDRDQRLQALDKTYLTSGVDDILRRVDYNLSMSIDAMAVAVLNGRQEDMSRLASDAVRAGLIEGAKSVTDGFSNDLVMEFSDRTSSRMRPELHMPRDWTEGLLEKLQSELLPTLLSTWPGGSGKDGSGNGRRGFLGAASVVGSLVPHPILKVVLTILPLALGGLFGHITEGQKLERIKDALRSQVLPDIGRRLGPEVRIFLGRAHEHALKLVTESFEVQIQKKKEALAQAAQEMAESDKSALLTKVEDIQRELKALNKAHL